MRRRTGSGGGAGAEGARAPRLSFLATCLAAACAVAAAPPEEAPRWACDEVPAGSVPDDPDELTGSYELVLVAAEGERAEGRLELRAQDPGLQDLVGPGEEPIRGASQPLVGTLEGDLTEAGAQVPGDAASTDPEAPGVAVIAMDGGDGEFLLRLGSEANVRGRVAFDEAFTVLWIRQADETGFYGGWESGGGGGGDTGGHFCAFRS